MQWDILFFFNSVLLGVGLAMDAFSVSLANGLNEPRMSRRRMLGIAGVFAGFQALMPMTGWICVHTIVQYFRAFEKLIPWIALDVYKRQVPGGVPDHPVRGGVCQVRGLLPAAAGGEDRPGPGSNGQPLHLHHCGCLLYTSSSNSS